MSYSLKTENKAWHQIVFGAGSAAGTTAAVVSEESMKCLRYCVSWVQYALKYLSQQMGFLRDYLVSLATNNKNKTMVFDSQNKQDQHVLLSIKRNMVGTIRKVIDIITVHASTALPYQAKAAVRRTILSLPNRWASLNDEMIGSDIPHEQNPSKQIEQQEVVLRLLAFGQESVDMLQSIHSVFEDTIQRAENWLGKLRMINPISSNSSNNTQKSSNDEDFCSILLPPIRDLHLSPASAVLE